LNKITENHIVDTIAIDVSKLRFLVMNKNNDSKTKKLTKNMDRESENESNFKKVLIILDK
tara:strand:- start:211 stop:390 length:180 start_codon:yes stop_codon:yes gene_type:complete